MAGGLFEAIPGAGRGTPHHTPHRGFGTNTNPNVHLGAKTQKVLRAERQIPFEFCPMRFRNIDLPEISAGRKTVSILVGFCAPYLKEG